MSELKRLTFEIKKYVHGLKSEGLGALAIDPGFKVMTRITLKSQRRSDKRTFELDLNIIGFIFFFQINVFVAAVFSIWPNPFFDLRHIITDLADIAAVLQKFVANHLLNIPGAGADPGNPIDHIADQMEPVQTV